MSVWPHLMQDQPVASNPLSYQLPSVARAQQSVANSSASPAVLGKMEDSRLGIPCDSHFPWGSSYEVIGWRVKWEGVPAVKFNRILPVDAGANANLLHCWERRESDIREGRDVSFPQIGNGRVG